MNTIKPNSIINTDSKKSKMESRPDFMTPIPKSPKKDPIPYILSTKRKYGEEFGDSFEDERYNQHIGEQFFQTNIGHGVLTSAAIHEALDSVIADFRLNLDSFLAMADKN